MPWSKHCSRRSNPELIWRTSFQSRRQAEHAISRYIDGFYNPIRRHSALGYKSPIKFEDEATKRQWLSTNRGQIQEALHNGWDKNDPRDAQVILHMLQVGATQRYHDRLGAGINDVQELSKTSEAIAKAKTEIQHHILTHYLPLYFPEIERFRGNSRSDWFFAFLDAFPTPASIMALSKEAVIEAAWDVVGRKVSKERLLADIYETARTSIGLPLPIDAPAIRMFLLYGDR